MRRTILVTGAPRTGTTPVGYVLARAKGACSIYEPWGPTGDIRFTERFPIVGTGDLTRGQVEKFVRDLSALRLRLKQQQRPDHARQPLGRRLLLKLIGTRTQHSLRLARLRPYCKHVIWKDPHAVLSVPDILEVGVPVVAVVRPPLAHAASYKRLGWRPRLQAIYPRFAARYGPDAALDTLVTRNHAPGVVESAAALWRMAYSPLAQVLGHPRLLLVTSTVLAADEVGCYATVFDRLELPFARARTYLLKRSAASRTQMREARGVHDWSRSIAHTNTNWEQILTPAEVDSVRALTVDVEERIGLGCTRGDLTP